MTRKIGVVTALLVSTAITSFIQGQAGATILANKADAGADKSAGFTYSPQIGVPVKLGPENYIDAGVYFQDISSLWNGGSDLNTLGVEVAYSFGL